MPLHVSPAKDSEVLSDLFYGCAHFHISCSLFQGGILKSACLLATRQGQVKRQEPSTGVP